MPTKKAPKKASKPAAKKPAAKPAKKASPSPAKPAPKAAAPPKKDAKPPAPPEPDFVRKAPAADRKAALEAILDAEGFKPPAPTPPPAPAAPSAPAPLPPAVREASPADRKAAVQALAEESGVTGVLAKAPWKRGGATPAPVPAPTPATPGAPLARTGPKLQMTKAPLTHETGRSAPRVVILDSNALMMQFQFHVDIEKEVRRILNFNFEVVVPRIVVNELERLAKEGNNKEAAEARMAAELAKTFRVEESPGDGDTGILRMAEKLNAIVVTNDKVLRARLRAKDIPNIYMRSRAFLTLEGHIPGM